MNIALLVLHVFLSLGIITLVLLQKGAGANAGAAFGGGGAGSVFGASGSSNFLSKTTALLATGFFINSLALAYLAAHRDVTVDSVIDSLNAPATEVVAPAADSAEPAADMPAADQPAADLDVPPPPAMPDDAANENTTDAGSDIPPPDAAPSADGGEEK